MSLALRYAARSEVGLIRPGNEDSAYAGPRLIAVADGMGGHAAGELASAITVATLAELDRPGLDHDDVLGELADAVTLSGERIVELIDAHPDLSGMGTTLTAIAMLDERIALIHVGDSRAYLLRDGELTQVTHDHTYVQTLVDSGRITPDEARVHPRRNLMMRAIDGTHVVEADVSVREAHVGDRFLLCSDGLSGLVDDDSLLRGLQLADATAAVGALVELALEAGAPDNVTAVVADVVDSGDETGNPVVVGAAGEPRTRDRLPGLAFPTDAAPDPDHLEPPDQEPHGITPGGVAPTPPGADVTALAAIYAGQRPKRVLGLGRRRAVALAVVVVLVVGLLALSVASWMRGQYFVGQSDGRVAIFQGVNASLGPITFSHVATVGETRVDALPDFERARVEQTIVATSQADAASILARLSAAAGRCQTDPTSAGCPPVTVTPNGVPPSASTSAPAPTRVGSTTPGTGG